MYEMCVGPQTGSLELVWHVVPRHQSSTLCGVELAISGPGSDTDRHCLSCMAHFQQLMETRDDQPVG